MALTRKMLKALEIEGDKADQIIEAHTDTVDGLKEQLATYKADAEKLAAVQKELDDAQQALKAAKDDGWKDKHDALKKEFEGYKAEITAKETKASKEKAARAYYESKGITGKALDIAMRGSGAEVDALELEDGKIRDAKALDALISGDFSGLVGKITTEGVKTATPPASPASSESKANTRAAQIAASYHNALYGEIKKE